MQRLGCQGGRDAVCPSHALSLGAAVVGANKKAFFGHANKSRVIVTLTKTL